MAKKKRELVSYLQDISGAPNVMQAYMASPASAFLQQGIEATTAMETCLRMFPKTKAGLLTKDAQDSMFLLSASMHATVMSHFETFQKSLFAGVLEASRFIRSFDVNKFMSDISKEERVFLFDAKRLGAYRGEPAPLGALIADCLKGWHDPEAVNRMFRFFFSNLSMFSNSDVKDLRLLWQLRHSIVHTGGWLTKPDSLKVATLHGKGGQPILLDYEFVPTVVRKLHPIVKGAVHRVEQEFRSKLGAALSAEDEAVVIELFKVDSSRKSWF